MHAQPPPPNAWLGYAISFVVIGIVMFIRWRRMGRSRRLRIEWLWVLPVCYLALATFLFVSYPPVGALGWALCALALAIGSALGWQRGKTMRIEIDPETHALNQRSSPAALIFIVVLIALRSGMRLVAAETEGWLHLNAMTLTDVLIALAVGLLSVQRLEMYLRARRLLDAARDGPVLR